MKSKLIFLFIVFALLTSAFKVWIPFITVNENPTLVVGEKSYSQGVDFENTGDNRLLILDEGPCYPYMTNWIDEYGKSQVKYDNATYKYHFMAITQDGYVHDYKGDLVIYSGDGLVYTYFVYNKVNNGN